MMPTFAMEPAHVRGTRWAFASSDATEVIVQDVASGKVIKRIPLEEKMMGPGAGQLVMMAAATSNSTR